MNPDDAVRDADGFRLRGLQPARTEAFVGCARAPGALRPLRILAEPKQERLELGEARENQCTRPELARNKVAPATLV